MIDKKSPLITVCVMKDEAEHLVIGSLLRSARLEYYSKNACIQNLFGAGQIGGYNLVVGAIEIQVAAHDLYRAKWILEKMAQDPDRDLNSIPGSDNHQSESEPELPDSESAESKVQEIFNRLANKSAIFSILWGGGIGSIFAVHYGLEALKLNKAGKYKLKGKIKAMGGIVLGLLEVFCFFPFWNIILG